MKIITQHLYPPIPDRSHDWMACLEDSDGDGPHGFGKTEAEAIKDLEEQIKDNCDHLSGMDHTICCACGMNLDENA